MVKRREDPGQAALQGAYLDIQNRRGADFVTRHPERAGQTIQDPTGLRAYFKDKIKALREGRSTLEIFPAAAIRFITREEITSLGAEGIVLSGANPKHPQGGIFLGDKTASSLDDEAEISEDATITSIVASGILKPVTGLIAQKPSGGIPDKLQGLPRIPVNCCVAAVFNEGKWSKSAVLPDGNWVVPGFDNAGWQYAQGVFEGMVATEHSSESPAAGSEIEVTKVDGKITLFRPKENAKRFIKSCEKMGLPPISVDQFIDAVTAAVQNNKEFIPEGGKLYIRPFMVGLRGGTGVNPAKQALFAVEVSPYGNYMATMGKDTPEVAPEQQKIRAKMVVSERDEIGRDKVAANYGKIIGVKSTYTQLGFKDILLLNKEGMIQEFSSSNFYRVTNMSGKKFRVSTPPIDANALPGITRMSLLEVLRDEEIQRRLGYEIIIDDNEPIHHSKLTKAITQGVFSSGTAAGISIFDEIETTDSSSGKSTTIEYDDQETKEFMAALNQLLTDLRKGKVEGYEDWAVEVN